MADGQIAGVERWYSAAELVGVAGLPTTVQGVRAMADRDGWPKRAKAKGKGCEYDFACLPDPAQRELRRRAAISAANSATRGAGETVGRKLALKSSIDAAVQQREREAGTARAAGLVGNARDRMNAKLDVLSRFDQFAQTFAGGKCMAMEAFVAAYRAGDIQMPVRSRLLIGCDVSPASLRRWQRQVGSQGLAALAGDYGNRAGSGLIDSQPALRDFTLGLVVEKPHIGAKNLHRILSGRFAGTGVAVPHERSLARWLANLKTEHAQMYTAIANPDAWKNKFMPAFGSASEDVVRLNQRWELDSSPADVMLVDGRHTIVQVVDVYSRRRVFFVAKTSSAAAVCEALRRAVIAWGIPEVVKIDNGADYVGERATRAFKGMKADVWTSEKFSPWQKPHVESGFRIFFHGIFEMLPGYIGHNVAEAQAIRSSQSFAERMFQKNAVVDVRMTADELQAFCDRWCAINENEPTDGLNGLTPREQVARWTGEVCRITNERVLDLLLAEAPAGNGGRTITKKGLRVEGYTYIAPELAALVGERVQVLYDERDIGRMVVYHNEVFACVAECPEIAGISRAEIAAAAKAITKQRVAEQRAAARELKKKIRQVDLVETAFALREEKDAPLALPPAQNVIDATPQFEEAQRAVEALQKPAFDGVEELRLMQDVVELRRGDFDADAERKARIESAFERLARFDELDELAQRRLNNYITTSEFQGFKTMLDDFGPESMGLDPKFLALISDDAFAHTYRRAMAVGYFDPPTKG